MVEMLFEDGTTASHENPAAIASEVEKMIRSLRRATSFREGEVQVGLHRKHFLPFLWAVHGGKMVDRFLFMGVVVYRLDTSADAK